MTDQIKDQLRLLLLALILMLLSAHSALAQKPELVVQTGHLNTVRAVAISPDNKLLASAGADKVIILWDVMTEKQLFSLKGHSEWIFSLAFSPKGQLLASGSSDGTVNLWNLAKGIKEYEISLQPSGVTFVAFSPDGNTLAISSVDKVIRLWDMPTRKMKVELRGHTETVTQVAFSPDGKYLASSCLDKTLKVWNLATKEIEFQVDYSKKDSSLFRLDDFKNPVEMVRELRHNDDPVSDYLRRHFSVNTLRLLREYDGSVPLSALLQQALIEELNKLLRDKSFYDSKRFESETLEDETKKLAAQNPTGEDLIRLNRLLLSSAYPFAIARSQDEIITSLAYSPDGNLLAFGTANNSISIYDIHTRELKMSIPAYGYQWLTPDRRFDYRRVQIAFRMGSGLYAAGALAFSSNKELAFVDGFKLRIVNPETGKEKLSREITSSAGSFAVAVSKDARLLVFNDGGTVKFINLLTEETKELKGVFEDVDSVLFSREGKTLTAWVGRTLRTWGDFQRGPLWVYSKLAADLVSASNAFIPAVGLVAHIETHSEAASASVITLLDASNPEVEHSLKGHAKPVNSIAVNPAGTILASCSEDGTIKLWDLEKRMPIKTIRESASRITFSPDGKLLASGNADGIKLWDVTTWQHRFIPNDSGRLQTLLFSPDSKVISATGDTLNGSLILWEVSTGKHIQTFRLDETPEDFKADSQDVRDQFTGTLLGDIKDYKSASGPLAFSPGSDFIASQVVNFRTGAYRIKIWNVNTDKEVHTLTGHSASIRSIAFAPDGKTLVSGSWDKTIKLWSTSTGKELATLVPLNEDDWVIFTPDGRFDTDTNLEEVKSLNLVMPDDALHPLPLDIFMRDYYEPKLLQRILTGGTFKPVRDISTLNRTQPEIKIKDVRRDGADTVEITLEVANVVSQTQHDAQGRALQSGVFDVQLFRDGQLVGNSTEERRLENYIKAVGGLAQTSTRDKRELALWQQANQIKLDEKGHATLTFPHIKLPQSGDVKEVKFSAYAFNKDRVKSSTAYRNFTLPPVSQARKGRAYIITVGVNAYENSDLNLSFAANDARQMQNVLTSRLTATAQYEEVVPVSLISDWTLQGDRKITTQSDATKENFQAILQLLAGKSGEVSPEVLGRIKNADKVKVATPDDLILILFSSHGYADTNGLFYFVPYDTGPGKGKGFTDGLRQHGISSDELSLWLREVDSGQMTLIVDACHSAASIEGSEFKPGPMGSRGLGQLSYDKGMRILTATQADNIALEHNCIRQGLLSYVLIQDGIEAGAADFSPRDGAILMAEWLQFGEANVPMLYEQLKQNTSLVKCTDADKQPRLVRELLRAKPEGKPDQANEERIQQPTLFDFTRQKRDVKIAQMP